MASNFFEDTAEPKSPTTSFATQNSRTMQSLQLRADPPVTEEQKWDAAQALLGFNTLETDGVRSWVSRVIPYAYPTPATAVNTEPPDRIHWASSIPEVTPVASPRGIDEMDRAQYSMLRFKIIYERKLYNLFNDVEVLAIEGPLAVAPARPDEGDALKRGWVNTRFIIRKVEDASTTVSVPGGLFKYVYAAVAARKPVHNAFPLNLMRAVVRYQWISVPVAAIPWQAIANCSQAVNDQIFDAWAPDTLRFDSWTLEPEVGPLGDILVNISYKFTWLPNINPPDGRQIGWVGVPRTIFGQFTINAISVDGDPATADNDDQRPFRRVDFSSLFRPD